MFETILENASRLCEAPLAVLGIVDHDTKTVKIPAHRGASAGFLQFYEQNPLPIEDSRFPVSQALSTGEVMNIPDFLAEQVPEGLAEVRENSVRTEGVRSAVVVPLVTSAEKIGVIVLYRREVKPFSSDQIALLETLSLIHI